MSVRWRRILNTLTKIDKCSAEYIQFQSHLDTNLASIKASLPELYARLTTSVAEYVDLNLYQTPDGKYGISFRKPGEIDELFMWVSCNVDIKTQTLQQIKENYQACNVYVVCGVDDGEILSDLFEYSEQDSFDPNVLVPIYVIEEEVFLFRIFLMLHEVSKLIFNQRVFFFVGEDVLDQFNDYINQHSFIKLPNEYVVNHLYQTSSVAPDISKLCLLHTEHAVSRIHTLTQSLNVYYNQRNLDDWRKIFSVHRKRALRVLGVTTRYSSFLQYCMRDWLQGFAEAGCQIKLLCEPNETSIITSLPYLEAIDELKPDVILVLDHVRDEWKCIPKKFPYVCWIQDMLPNILEDRGYHLSDFDFTYVVSKNWVNDLPSISGFLKSTTKHLNIGFSSQTYFPTDDKKTIDVLYVTHLYKPSCTLQAFRDQRIGCDLTKAERCLMDTMKISTDELLNIYQHLVVAMNTKNLSYLTLLIQSTRLRYVAEFLKDALSETKQFCYSENEALITYLVSHGNRFYRDIISCIKLRPITYLIDRGIDVTLYGNHWEKYLSCQPYANGPMENGYWLNKIMNQSKICINNSGGLSFHMRAIEIMASRSFMLSRKIPKDSAPLSDHYEDGDEVIYFENEANLYEKVNIFLNNPQQRMIIAERAYVKTIRKFSYENVAKNILNDINDRLQSHVA